MRPRSFGLLILTGLLLIRIWDPIPVKSLRLQVFDYYQKIQPRISTNSQTIVVDLDEASLAQYGQWPWPRTMMAQLLTKLFNSGVRAVAFDIIFAEHDRMSPGRIADDLIGLDTQMRNQLRSLPDNDEIFADTLTQTPVVVSQGALSNGSLINQDLPLRKPPIAEIGGNPRPHLLSYLGILRNIPKLEAAAAGHGIITINPETDGVVRRIPALVRIKKDVLPTLSLELLRVALGQSVYSVNTDFAGVRSVGISDIQIPTDKTGRIWIHFAKLNPERYVSAKHLLNGTVSPQKLADKLVLIGSSALGLGDNKATPIDESLPGVEIHAQILDMIEDQSFLTRPNFALAQELIILLLLGLFIIFLVPFFGAVQTLFLGACIAAGMVATSWYWYVAFGVLIDVSYGAVGILVTV